MFVTFVGSGLKCYRCVSSSMPDSCADPFNTANATLSDCPTSHEQVCVKGIITEKNNGKSFHVRRSSFCATILRPSFASHVFDHHSICTDFMLCSYPWLMFSLISLHKFQILCNLSWLTYWTAAFQMPNSEFWNFVCTWSFCNSNLFSRDTLHLLDTLYAHCSRRCWEVDMRARRTVMISSEAGGKGLTSSCLIWLLSPQAAAQNRSSTQLDLLSSLDLLGSCESSFERCGMKTQVHSFEKKILVIQDRKVREPSEVWYGQSGFIIVIKLNTRLITKPSNNGLSTDWTRDRRHRHAHRTGRRLLKNER